MADLKQIENSGHLHITDVPFTQTIIIQVTGDHEIATNIPHVVMQHGNGFDVGRRGSGPSELALNLAECMLRTHPIFPQAFPHITYVGPITAATTGQGVYFDIAWLLQHELVDNLILWIDQDNGDCKIPYEFVWSWVKAHLPENYLAALRRVLENDTLRPHLQTFFGPNHHLLFDFNLIEFTTNSDEEMLTWAKNEEENGEEF